MDDENNYLPLKYYQLIALKLLIIIIALCSTFKRMNSSHSNNNNRTREEKWSKKSQPFEAFDGALEVRYIGAMGGDKVRRNLNIGGYSPPKVSYFPPLNESPTRKHMLMNNEIKGS